MHNGARAATKAGVERFQMAEDGPEEVLSPLGGAVGSREGRFCWAGSSCEWPRAVPRADAGRRRHH